MLLNCMCYAYSLVLIDNFKDNVVSEHSMISMVATLSMYVLVCHRHVVHVQIYGLTSTHSVKSVQLYSYPYIQV